MPIRRVAKPQEEAKLFILRGFWLYGHPKRGKIKDLRASSSHSFA